MVLGAFMVVEDAWRRFTGFCGMRRRGHADRQGGKNPPWQKDFPARWDLGLCDLYSCDLLSCTDAGAALSYRSGSLYVLVQTEVFPLNLFITKFCCSGIPFR